MGIRKEPRQSLFRRRGSGCPCQFEFLATVGQRCRWIFPSTAEIMELACYLKRMSATAVDWAPRTADYELDALATGKTDGLDPSRRLPVELGPSTQAKTANAGGWTSCEGSMVISIIFCGPHAIHHIVSLFLSLSTSGRRSWKCGTRTISALSQQRWSVVQQGLRKVG